MHLFAYKGMWVFLRAESPVATQLWIAMRYVLAASYLAAMVFLRRTLNVLAALLVYGLITAGVLVSIFTGAFPRCFSEETGLTPRSAGQPGSVVILRPQFWGRRISPWSFVFRHADDEILRSAQNDNLLLTR